MSQFRVYLPTVSAQDACDAKLLAISVIKNLDDTQLLGYLEAEELPEKDHRSE